MGNSVIGMGGHAVVHMGRQPMVVLGMIVIVVGVRVERGHSAGHPNQCRNEQQRQDTVHTISL
jgi:hypothetical protein